MLLYLLMCTFIANVAGGTIAYQGKFQYQVSIRQNGTFICSGSILNRDTVLTAASCLDDNKDVMTYTVIVGDTNRNVIEGTEQGYTVKRIAENFQSGSATHDNDIALMILERSSMEYNSFVHNVRIPKQDETWYYGNTNAKITGWGDQDLLQSQDAVKILPVPEQTTCVPTKGDKMMCVDSITDCSFDIGSPLVIYANDRYVQVGIATAMDTCEGEKIALFTDVGAHTLWIDSETGDIDIGSAAGPVTKLSTALIVITTVIMMILPLC